MNPTPVVDLLLALVFTQFAFIIVLAVLLLQRPPKVTVNVENYTMPQPEPFDTYPPEAADDDIPTALPFEQYDAEDYWWNNGERPGTDSEE